MDEDQSQPKYILLVDPNRRVRKGLEVSLATYRYEVLSADNTAEVELELKNKPVSIALVDCGLLKDDSFQDCRSLLADGRARAVVMMSSAPTRDMVIKSVRAGAMEFVAKPVRADVLNVKIKKAYARTVRGVGWAPDAHSLIDFGKAPMSTSQKIDIIMKRAGTIRALPHAVGKILELVATDESNADELAKAVESDPSIAAMLMKRARSSFYARTNPPSNLKQAVVRLGFKECSELAISLSMFKLFSKEDKTFGFSRLGFWLHSISCGLLARQVSKQAGVEGAGKALMVGLLHDIGKMIFDDFLTEEFQIAVQTAATTRQTLFDAEMATLERTHVMVGAAIVEQWRFPPIVQEIILDHHQHEKYLSQNPAAPNLLGSVYLANQIAKAILMGEAGDYLVQDVPASMWRSYGFDGPLDANFLEEFYREIEMYCDFLEIPEADLGTRLEHPKDRGTALLFDPECKNTLLMQIFLAHQGFSTKIVSDPAELVAHCGSGSLCLMILGSAETAADVLAAIEPKSETWPPAICVVPNLDGSEELSRRRPWVRVVTTPIDCFELHSLITELDECDDEEEGANEGASGGESDDHR